MSSAFRRRLRTSVYDSINYISKHCILIIDAILQKNSLQIASQVRVDQLHEDIARLKEQVYKSLIREFEISDLNC